MVGRRRRAGALAGIGGTIRNLAAAVQKQMELPDVDVQGFALTREALENLIDELAARPASKRGAVRGIKPDRADVILGGALVLATAIEHGGFDELEVTEAGLREGVFFERLLEDREPPLLDDVRRESVENLSHRFETDPEHVAHVAGSRSPCSTASSRRSLHAFGNEERELLWAAGMLHDIGMTVDYDDHHRHSHYLILHTGLPGYTPREVELMALIARYHRKGEPDASELGALAEDGDADRLLLLSAIIRLAENFERSRDRAIETVRVKGRKKGVELEPVPRSAKIDASVPIWAAQRTAALLAEAIGRDVSVSEPG